MTQWSETNYTAETNTAETQEFKYVFVQYHIQIIFLVTLILSVRINILAYVFLQTASRATQR
jgi:hypothetical protein